MAQHRNLAERERNSDAIVLGTRAVIERIHAEQFGLAGSPALPQASFSQNASDMTGGDYQSMVNASTLDRARHELNVSGLEESGQAERMGRINTNHALSRVSEKDKQEAERQKDGNRRLVIAGSIINAEIARDALKMVIGQRSELATQQVALQSQMQETREGLEAQQDALEASQEQLSAALEEGDTLKSSLDDTFNGLTDEKVALLVETGMTEGQAKFALGIGNNYMTDEQRQASLSDYLAENTTDEQQLRWDELNSRALQTSEILTTHFTSEKEIYQVREGHRTQLEALQENLADLRQQYNGNDARIAELDQFETWHAENSQRIENGEITAQELIDKIPAFMRDDFLAKNPELRAQTTGIASSASPAEIGSASLTAQTSFLTAADPSSQPLPVTPRLPVQPQIILTAAGRNP